MRPPQPLEPRTLLVSSGHPESGHEYVRPEALKQVELFPETVPLPLGVPVYVFPEGKAEPRQRLIVAGRPAPGRDKQRPAEREFGGRETGQRKVDSRGGNVSAVVI